MMRHPLRFSAIALTLAAGLLLSGCVEQLGEIDRTQANVLKKSDFHGVWYRMGTITDMPADAAGLGFVGQNMYGGYDGTGKVMFDIQETLLIAYPVTERVKDGDAKWHRKKIRNYWDKDKADEFIEMYVGNPVAMYAITSHFDVIRDYSTSTGAQTNVLIENTTDRPWYKRTSFRVDWATNSLADFSFPYEGAGGVKVAGSHVPHHYVQENEKDDPNRFNMEYFNDKEGQRIKDKGANYFHYIKRLYATPSARYCSYYSLSPYACGGTVFDVRVSFRRADNKSVNDFEVRDYHNDPEAERFGFFMANRYTFDEEYGLTYTGHDYKAQIWNLWQNSKVMSPAKDANGKTISCHSNHDCAAPTVCDQPDWFEKGVCSIGQPIEYTKRGLRPVVYHLNAEHPVSALPAAYKVADNWSDTFKETVSWLYFWEEKWGEDKVKSADGTERALKGFETSSTIFGQRFCQTHADCGTHAVAQRDEQIAKGSNVLAVGTEKGVMITVDEVATREKVGGDAYVMFVNASPGTGKAKMTVGSLSIDGAEFKVGKVDAHTTAGKLPKAEISGRMTVTVTAGGKTATLANAEFRKNRVHWVVFFGGDQIALAQSQLTKQGVRAFHAINAGKTKNQQGNQFTAGAPLEIGINGVREKGPVEYGNFTDYVHHTAQTVHAVFLKIGSRGDVTCQQVDGQGVCSGWKQKLTELDRARRTEILNKEIPHAFVLCTNIYSGGAKQDSCGGADVRAKKFDDCRYWHEDKAGVWHNPCKEFVANPDKPKMIGDLRYNFIYWVTNPHSSSPLGYGPSASDPDTGQLFWGTAYIYGAALSTYGQYGKDLVDLLNGDLDVDSLINGQYIKSYIQALNKSGVDDTEFGAAKAGHGHDHAGSGAGRDAKRSADYFTPEAAMKRATKDIRKEIFGRASDDDLKRLSKAVAAPQSSAAEQKMMDLQEPKKLHQKFMDENPTFDLSEVKARWEKLRGTPIERALINDELALGLSEGDFQPGDAIDPDMMKKLSPASWAGPSDTVNERTRMQYFALQNIYAAEFTDPALVAMAKRLKCDAGEEPTNKLPDGADTIGEHVCYKGSALRIALQNAIFRGVLEHEIGHTVGLRHNFSASSDVLNYFDGYYDIREKEPVYCASVNNQFGQVVANNLCETSFGETCKYLSCTGDSDCPSGYACASGACIDTNNTKVGICEGTVDTYFPCKGQKDCDAAGGVCQADGWCGARVGCKADTDCVSGELCTASVCANQVTGKPRTTLLVHPKTTSMKKYMPRPAPTASEIEKKRTEYQYSSIMDYGQKINADFLGLGKYDKAAIKYGYGRMLEVFADTSFMRRQLAKYAKESGSTPQGLSWRMRTTSWEFAGSITHPFMYLNNWMTPEYLNKRDTVPGVFVDAEPNLASKYGRSMYDMTYFQVPYKYCSDEYRGSSLGCYYFDTGAHMQEIVYHAAEQMKEYYIFDAFKRERLWFGWYGSPRSYMSRVQTRWMLPIMAAARYYAIYNNIFRIYSFFPFYDNHPMYMKGLREASEMAFRELTKVLTSPAPGSYTFDKDTNEYVNISFKEKVAGSQLDIPIGAGKLPHTNFATKNGYYYAQHPLWIGSMWDKLAAISSMVSSQAYFSTTAVGEQLPLFRGTAIGFNTLYPKELSEVLGGVAAGAIEEIGGYVNSAKDGKLSYEARDPFEPNDPTKARVPPSINNLTLRLWAATMAIVNLPAGFDPSYTDGMAVWLKGSSESHYLGSSDLHKCGSAAPQKGTKPAVVCVEEYYDPVGKKTYVAPTPNYSSTFFSPTHYVVKRLNALKSEWKAANGTEKSKLFEKMSRELEILDYYRLLYKIFGAIGS